MAAVRTIPTNFIRQGSKTASRFLTFEGTEGVGKSTAIDGVCTYLAQQGIEFIKTREPGGTPFAEYVRAGLLDNHASIHADAELLALFAARADHLQRVILPNLRQGKWVLCDRFLDSTVAYQGFGRSNGSAVMLEKINLLAKVFIERLPDLTFWLDFDSAQGLARARQRAAADRFEREPAEFFAKVYQGFLHQYQQHPERICCIDASANKQSIVDGVIAALQVRGWI